MNIGGGGAGAESCDTAGRQGAPKVGAHSPFTHTLEGSMVKTSVHDCFRICTRTALTVTTRQDKHDRPRRRRLTVATTSLRAWKPDSTGKTCSVPSAIWASCRDKLGLV